MTENEINVCCSVYDGLCNAVKWGSLHHLPYEEQMEVARKRANHYLANEAHFGIDEKEKELLRDFYFSLQGILYNHLEKYWLKGEFGSMGDDSFMDFIDEILSYGWAMYAIVLYDWEVAKKFVNDYEENFHYIFY